MARVLPPLRINTPRLVLRCWEPVDAPLLREAVDASLDHLRPWMPWAASEPASLATTIERLTRYKEAFEAGEDFVYGVFSGDESRVVGGSGLHTRVGPSALEIGYWIRAEDTGRGLATEAARALTTAGLQVPDISQIQIHCDPNNVRSRRVPERLGYRLLEVRRADKVTSSGEPRDTMVFCVTESEWRART